MALTNLVNFAQLITPQYLFTWTTVDNNVDPQLINANITIAQDTNIQSILGQTLYWKLMNDVATGAINSEPNYQTLINTYVQPALAHFTHYHLMFDLRTRDTNKGVLEKTTDAKISHPSTDDEFNAKLQHILSVANYYNETTKLFLMNNMNSYPEYTSYTGIDPRIARKETYNNRIGGVKTNNKRGKAGWQSEGGGLIF
jgi:hypothetical protein